MCYIRKEFQEKLEIIDCRCNDIPEKWQEFIDENKIKHNLIIKSNGISICTNCKHEFITKKKVGEYKKCPNCKNTYLIKSSRLKNYEFKNTLILLDKVENDLVFRYFEICSTYQNRLLEHNFNTSVVEYARSFFEKHMDVVNDRVSRCQCYIHINHWYNPGVWRKYTRHYSYGKTGVIYPYNLTEILKDSEYKYLNLKEFSKSVKELNYEYLLENIARYSSFEMLIKLRLYKLALDARKFNSHGTFNKIFGVSKEYYSFIKRHNITYKELEILRLIKQKDIKKIRYLSNFNINALKEITTYVTIDNFIVYAKKNKKEFDIHIYKDYLRLANLMGLDLKNKKYIFPDNLKKKHDELEKEYEIDSRRILNQSIAKRYYDLKKNIYKDEKFVIVPAKSIEDLEKESKEQSNCVRTYSNKYAESKCDIYFMRLLKNKNKSLVTVEVKDNEIVQSRTKFNNKPEEIQLLFLKEWQNKVLKKCNIV